MQPPRDQTSPSDQTGDQTSPSEVPWAPGIWDIDKTLPPRPVHIADEADADMDRGLHQYAWNLAMV